MLQLGLIGCGYIARKHVETISQLNQMSLIAVSDIHEKQMEELANYYNRLKQKDVHISFYKDYKHMLKDPQIDAVIISSISSLHAEMVKNALKNNKHVIVEKPLALSLKEANEIIYLAQLQQKQVLVCHQLRYRPMLRKIKKLIEEKHLGELHLGVVTLMLNRSPDYYDETDWKGTWEKDGGMLMNQGIHLVDLLLWMMGDIHSIYGEISTTSTNKETEDIALGIIQFKNGGKGLINANTISKPENIGYYLSIFGEKGSLRIGGKSFDRLEHCYVQDLPQIKEKLETSYSDINEHALMYKNFYQSIVGKEEILMSATEGKKALEGIFSLYQSSRKEESIYFPIENFSTINMLENQ